MDLRIRRQLKQHLGKAKFGVLDCVAVNFAFICTIWHYRIVELFFFGGGNRAFGSDVAVVVVVVVVRYVHLLHLLVKFDGHVSHMLAGLEQVQLCRNLPL